MGEENVSYPRLVVGNSPVRSYIDMHKDIVQDALYGIGDEGKLGTVQNANLWVNTGMNNEVIMV